MNRDEPKVAADTAPEVLNLRTYRARNARLGKRIGRNGYLFLLTLSVLCVIGGIALVILQYRLGYSLAGFGGLVFMPALWWKFFLSRVPVSGTGLNGRLSSAALQVLKPGVTYTPQSLWRALQTHWHLGFLSHHLLLPSDQMADLLSSDATKLGAVMLYVSQLADTAGSSAIEVGHVAAALLLSSPDIGRLLTSNHLDKSDVLAVLAWLDRGLETMRRPRARAGGIGRDWANGFTPRLDRYAYNITAAVEAAGGAHFGSLAGGTGVTAMKAAFSQGAGAIALIGPDGIGKTSHVYALAQNVLAEATDRKLSHQQIYELDASAIISSASQPGQLEYILNSLMNEAAHAGNIMLFLDDAELFLQPGVGSFNASQLLLPVLQSRAVPMVLALTPHAYEGLRATSPSFAGLLTPVVLQEPPETAVLEILCDSATGFEVRHQVLISYEAIKEAYRLSGRYNTDMAYPGKAIRLLEQSLTHGQGKVITAASVQAAIEQTTGVKAATASPVEADQLLNLEAEIHKRMINQNRAVSVVASALRRSRAGVSSPKRPIGSFLFLGPTGVGKTELAKAIAATYFGDEHNMIRLDMSEYQQPSDVSRLLSDGQGETSNLLLQIRQRPFSVVLLDEVEKAHPTILNLLLQLLDEGQLTDTGGRTASFRDAVVIATSNAGADAIRQHISAGEELEAFEETLTNQLIESGQFRPELLNRFDEIVLFRPLKPDELNQVVRLMLAGINATLATQHIRVELTDAAVSKVVAVGNDPRLGARPMRRALQRAVEDTVAGKILRGEAQPGDTISLDAADLTL